MKVLLGFGGTQDPCPLRHSQAHVDTADTCQLLFCYYVKQKRYILLYTVRQSVMSPLGPCLFAIVAQQGCAVEYKYYVHSTTAAKPRVDRNPSHNQMAKCITLQHTPPEHRVCGSDNTVSQCNDHILIYNPSPAVTLLHYKHCTKKKSQIIIIIILKTSGPQNVGFTNMLIVVLKINYV